MYIYIHTHTHTHINPGVELLGHIVVLFLVFWKTSILFSPVAAAITFLPTVYKGSFSSTSSPIFVICIPFDDSHSDQCEVISHCGFDVHFPDG